MSHQTLQSKRNEWKQIRKKAKKDGAGKKNNNELKENIKTLREVFNL